jgi:glycosyltransferase involved in cell wall biosynthesis
VAGCDVCINCSTHEAFGLVIVEAMACGTVVVVAHGGGPAELVEDGHTGLCFEPGNSTSLARALKRVLADGNLRSRLAAAAYDHARRKFDMSVNMRSFPAELLKHCPTIND